jgi:hypothetical protein
VHLFYLIGFENRLLVLLRWAHSFFTRGRGARLITEAAGIPPWQPLPRNSSWGQPGSIP